MSAAPVDPICDAAPITAGRRVHTLEPCTTCNKYVEIPGGGQPGTCDARGYDGLTADGDPVCAICWCPGCKGAHASAAEHDQCEIDGGEPSPCDSGVVVAPGTIR